MPLSTDFPYGVRAVRQYIEHRGDTRLPMNVSAEADAAYIAEKRLRIGPVTLTSWPVGTCSRCGGVIRNAPFLSNTEPGEYCSRECRDAGKASSHRKSAPIAKSKNSHFQPIQNTRLTEAVLEGLNSSPNVTSKDA
jgi:hypothetical protein